ncbi:MAG: hypothetical protein E7316_10590 [Clostridiales bacterium]|nr:hypothetical protein [Clostridiales bacterium]
MMYLRAIKKVMQVNHGASVSCELLRRLLVAAWEQEDAESVALYSQAVDGLTLQRLQAENAKSI